MYIYCFAVKPQQQAQAQSTSPYKKPPPPTTSTPIKPQSPLPVVITPKAPDVTIKSGNTTDSELPVSLQLRENQTTVWWVWSYYTIWVPSGATCE